MWALLSCGCADAADSPDKPPTLQAALEAPSFFLVENRVSLFRQLTATNPGVAGTTAKQVIEFNHFDVWAYGTNLFNVDLLKSDHADPAGPCLSPTGPVSGCAGATEVYGFFRSTFGFNELLGTTAFSAGPLRNVSFLIGADANGENRYSDAAKRAVVAGLQFGFDLPYKGFFNVSPAYYKEFNHNAYAQCDEGRSPGVDCITGGNISYRGTWAVEMSYNMDLGFLPQSLQYFSVSGRANFYGPKGGENAPLPSTPTKVEIDSEPVRLTFDAGKAFRGPAHAHELDLWVAYRYWGNKYGFDRDASALCTGLAAGSCVEQSIYSGITIKF